MRTTVNLADALLDKAKKRAAEENLTLGEFVESALRERLLRKAPVSAANPFRLVIFGTGGLQPGLDYGQLKHLADDEEIARLGGARVSHAAEDDETR